MGARRPRRPATASALRPFLAFRFRRLLGPGAAASSSSGSLPGTCRGQGLACCTIQRKVAFTRGACGWSGALLLETWCTKCFWKRPSIVHRSPWSNVTSLMDFLSGKFLSLRSWPVSALLLWPRRPRRKRRLWPSDTETIRASCFFPWNRGSSSACQPTPCPPCSYRFRFTELGRSSSGSSRSPSQRRIISTSQHGMGAGATTSWP
mmetsp:Transcript_13955/g.35755  ORF Transcript_13955/g.35755 Transcript_13955/m.35755 type:complete len:206 (-) Transcript_13955:240-857(-)